MKTRLKILLTISLLLIAPFLFYGLGLLALHITNISNPDLDVFDIGGVGLGVICVLCFFALVFVVAYMGISSIIDYYTIQQFMKRINKNRRKLKNN